MAALTKLQILGPHLEILIGRNEMGLNNFFIFFLLGALQGMFPSAGMEPRLLVVEALSLSHWTAREVPRIYFKKRDQNKK